MLAWREQLIKTLHYICKDYGRHKGHQHNLLELEAEKMRVTMSNACTHLKKFMEEVSETSRRLGKRKIVRHSVSNG